jgi:hypothetical protein
MIILVKKFNVLKADGTEDDLRMRSERVETNGVGQEGTEK